MPTLVALSELDAVNQMLISIGQAPVNTLESTGIRDVAIAQTILHNTSREVQSRGWDFNVDTEYELVPDGSDNILIPANALVIDPSDTSKRYVQRLNVDTMCFWDLDDKTFTITDNPLKVDVTWFYAFEAIPTYARNAIATKAARRFQAYAVGSQILYEYTQQDEIDAFIELNRHAARVQDANILSNGDWTTSIFHRRSTLISR